MKPTSNKSARSGYAKGAAASGSRTSLKSALSTSKATSSGTGTKKKRLLTRNEALQIVWERLQHQANFMTLMIEWQMVQIENAGYEMTTANVNELDAACAEVAGIIERCHFSKSPRARHKKS